VLREGLRAEIPAVFDLAGRARRPVVARMAPALAALGALGAEALTSALLRSAQGAVVLVSGTFPFRSTEFITVVAYAVGVLFAFGSARWRGVAAVVLLFALLWSEQFALATLGNLVFCERSGTSCDLLSRALAGVWPQLLGVVVGVAAGRAVRQGTAGIAALALGIGVASLAFPIMRVAIIPFVGANPTGQPGYLALIWVIAAQALGAAVLGLVAGRFGRRTAVDALVIAAFYIGPWLPQIRYWTEQTPPGRGFILEMDWMLVVPIGYAAVALLGLWAGSVVPRYFATRTPTIP
jgi:hypothetical protein